MKVRRSRTFLSIGAECSNTQTLPTALDPQKLDPDWEWLIAYQSRLDASEVELTPMAIERMSVVPTSDIFTLVIPPPVQSPVSSISSAASIGSFDLDDSESTIQISDPLP